MCMSFTLLADYVSNQGMFAKSRRAEAQCLHLKKADLDPLFSRFFIQQERGTQAQKCVATSDAVSEDNMIQSMLKLAVPFVAE